METVRVWAPMIGGFWGNNLSVYGYNVFLIGDSVARCYAREGNKQETEKTELEGQKKDGDWEIRVKTVIV